MKNNINDPFSHFIGIWWLQYTFYFYLFPTCDPRFMAVLTCGLKIDSFYMLIHVYGIPVLTCYIFIIRTI